VRDSLEFNKFSLPGAVSIPIDSLFIANNIQLLSSDAFKIIFYSNGTSLADHAWLLSKTAGFPNVYVMKGGLNEWFNSIILPKPPKEWASQEEFEKYSFRLFASRFFTGAGEQATEISANKK